MSELLDTYRSGIPKKCRKCPVLTFLFSRAKYTEEIATKTTRSVNRRSGVDSQLPLDVRKTLRRVTNAEDMAIKALSEVVEHAKASYPSPVRLSR